MVREAEAGPWERGWRCGGGCPRGSYMENHIQGQGGSSLRFPEPLSVNVFCLGSFRECSERKLIPTPEAKQAWAGRVL